MNKKDEIPAEDLKAINDSFKTSKDATVIVKDGSGATIHSQKKTLNERSYTISHFKGRTLRHSKSVIPVDGKQILIGFKGQNFDEIPVGQRQLATWFESDFE